MARRRLNVSGVACPLTADEAAVVAEMRAAGGFPSTEALVRCALWNQARNMGIDPPAGAFDLEPRAVARKRAPKSPRVPTVVEAQAEASRDEDREACAAETRAGVTP